MIRAFMRAPKKPQQQRPSEKQFADNKTKEERMDARSCAVCARVRACARLAIRSFTPIPLHTTIYNEISKLRADIC